MSFSLEEQHAFITGAGQGIGFATAVAFLQAGAKVSLTDQATLPTPAVKALLRKNAAKAHYLPLDVTQQQTVTPKLMQAEERFGPVSILFNNAAVFALAPLLESDEASYEKLFGVNVKGMFFVMQKTLRRMISHKLKGCVINLASQAGRRGEALVSHYCATKAAVISYTQSAALAMAPYGIRVNALAPGVIETPMWETVDALFAKYENLAIGEKKKQVGAAVPLGGMGTAKQVAAAALFLASPAASYITAQTLNVDGGRVMS